MNKAIILVVDDDIKVRELLRKTLNAEGYDARTAESMLTGRLQVKDIFPDLVILDRMLPDGDGVELCRELRASEDTKNVPVLFISAKKSLEDRISGLKTGGDDYLPKPFNLKELIARVAAILRRTKYVKTSENTVLQINGIKLDTEKHECIVDGKPIKLFPKEFELLKAFMARPGRLLDREFLSNNVWKWDNLVTTHTTDTTIQRLRKKLGSKSEAIETIKGYGYRFKANDK